MNIYKYELRAGLKTALIWILVLVFLAVVGMAKYSAGAQTGDDSLNMIVAGMPKSLQSLFGVGTFDFSLPLDFYAIIYIYLALIAAFQAVSLGAGIIAKEERDKTVEFLLAKPVPRARVITAKLCAGVTLLLLSTLAVTAASLWSLSRYTPNPADYTGGVLQLMCAMFALSLFYMLIGALAACTLKKPKLSGSVSSGVVLLFFVLYIAAEISGQHAVLVLLTPFEYLSAKAVLRAGVSPVHLAILFFAAAAMLFACYRQYNKRDMLI